MSSQNSMSFNIAFRVDSPYVVPKECVDVPSLQWKRII